MLLEMHVQSAELKMNTQVNVLLPDSEEPPRKIL